MRKKKREETATEFLSRIGRKGAHAAKKVLTHKDRRKFGKRGGRPPDPEIKKLMEEEGLSRQAAWYRLRKAGGIKRPVGRPEIPEKL